ncbi:hypothetical protein K438DRAFT_1800185 [Mycena galopus ATCC 62051]|nr:hypothetical protein K438DRAFT_1800185 [Mycena galopus ATCC 62051]
MSSCTMWKSIITVGAFLSTALGVSSSNSYIFHASLWVSIGARRLQRSFKFGRSLCSRIVYIP